MEMVFSGSNAFKTDGVAHGHSAKRPKPSGSLGIKDEPDSHCSVCLEQLTDRTTVKLQCGHIFHLDCIGSAFNKKNRMECPLCRNVEQGRWLFANPPVEEFEFEFELFSNEFQDPFAPNFHRAESNYPPPLREHVPGADVDERVRQYCTSNGDFINTIRRRNRHGRRGGRNESGGGLHGGHLGL